MPIALRPGKRAFKVYLDSDADVLEAERSAFIVGRVMTCGEVMDLSGELEASAGKEAVKLICDRIRGALIGWRNMRTNDPALARRFGVELSEGGDVELPFKPELLEYLLGIEEAKELFQKLSAGGLTEDDQKNSGSP